MRIDPEDVQILVEVPQPRRQRECVNACEPDQVVITAGTQQAERGTLNTKAVGPIAARSDCSITTTEPGATK